MRSIRACRRFPILFASLHVLLGLLTSCHVQNNSCDAFSDSSTVASNGVRRLLVGKTRKNGSGSATALLESGNDSESKISITAELFEDEETIRAREIAESFVRAKAAVSTTATTTSSSTGVPSALEIAEAEVTGVDANKDDITSQTTAVMDKAKQELDELKFQVGRIDEERVKALEAKDAEMQRMKFTLQELREKVSESEAKAIKAEKKIEHLEVEGQGAMEKNEGLVARIKAQFKKEKEDLTTEVNDISEQLQQAKEKAAKEISEVKASAEKVEGELEAKLRKVEDSLADASTQKQEMRESHRTQLMKQQKEAERLQEASDRVAAQDKRALRNKAWNLQTQLDAAKLDLIQAEKEIDKFKAERVRMEKRMEEMQREVLNTIQEVKAQAERERAEMKKEVIAAMASSKTEKYEALKAMGFKYDQIVSMSADSIVKAQQAAEAKVRFVRQEMNVRMKDTKNMYDREAIALREQTEVEILKVKANANSMVKMVEDDLAEKEAVIAVLKAERKSLRKIGKMAFTLVRERSSKLRDRVVNKIARRRRSEP